MLSEKSLVEEKKGANKFTTAADKFFGDVAEQLEETVDLKAIPGIQRATMIAELVYKVNQSIKIMKEEKGKKILEQEDGRSYIDKVSDKKRKVSLNGG